jgi:hypothetical protein
MSGYTRCACRDCMDATVSSDTSKPELCDGCQEAGCIPFTERGDVPDSYFECCRDDAYGTECVNGDGPCPNACQCGCESGTYECQCSYAHEEA